MKVKQGVIRDAQAGFVAIMQAQMPIKLSYTVGKNLKKLDMSMADFEKLRKDLIQKYGTKDEKTGGMQVTAENMEAFNKEYDELADQEVEVDIWKLSLTKLSDAGVKLTPVQLLSIDSFIEDDTPQVPSAVPVK